MEAPNKIIIVGQGLAGTMLAWRLLNRGLAVEIWDKPELSRSSYIAAGIINPIVLKRMRWVKDAEKFLPAMLPFYRKCEKILQDSFLETLPLYHIIQDAGEANQWQEHRDHPYMGSYLKDIEFPSQWPAHAPMGVGKMMPVHWLRTANFLTKSKSHFQKLGILKEQKLSISHMHQELAAESEAIILANGHLMRNLYPAAQAFFTPTRGEVLIIHSPALPQESILHRQFFILPLGNHLFKVGATYAWDHLEDTSTTKGKNTLQEGLEKMITAPYSIREHWAGVRPNIKDRKPVLGRLKPGLYCFNGMGSRGALMAPYLSAVMRDFLLAGTAIPHHWNVARFALSAP